MKVAPMATALKSKDSYGPIKSPLWSGSSYIAEVRIWFLLLRSSGNNVQPGIKDFIQQTHNIAPTPNKLVGLIMRPCTGMALPQHDNKGPFWYICRLAITNQLSKSKSELKAW